MFNVFVCCWECMCVTVGNVFMKIQYIVCEVTADKVFMKTEYIMCRFTVNNVLMKN